MNKKVFLLLFFLTGVSRLCFSQQIWTIGPMIHINFGGEKVRVSYAIESSYWNLNNFYYGIDGGIEFESNKFRIYSEMQTGFGLAGIAFGPLLEINTNEGTAHFGTQGSLWGNYFLGVDFRKRWVNKTKYNCFGVYAKLPFVIGGNGSSGNGSHHYSDFDD